MNEKRNSSETDIFKLLKQATVRLPCRSGLGVYVGEGLILTAAHCVNSNEGRVSPLAPEASVEKIITPKGEEFIVGVSVVELVGDIAVLCKCMHEDDEEYGEAFERFCNETTPVRICTDSFYDEMIAGGGKPQGPKKPLEMDVLEDYTKMKKEETFRVYMLTHENEVRTGKAKLIRHDSSTLFVEIPIDGGTSGGPIVNDSGDLVAVVSQGNQGGPQPIPYRTLPTWVVKILNSSFQAS